METSENMIKKQDFERILIEGDREQLEELKAWLFKENIRLEMEWAELRQLEERLIKERGQFQMEMSEVHRRIVNEKKRLKQDEQFFDKKMAILKNGFAQLEEDRRKFEKDKLQLETEKSVRSDIMGTDLAEMLFQGVNSQLTLKKRYKDLIKMFHPDNIAGDNEMVLTINKIYEELKKNYEPGKKTAAY